MLEDGRMRCVYCGRFFSDERIEKHQAGRMGMGMMGVPDLGMLGGPTWALGCFWDLGRGGLCVFSFAGFLGIELRVEISILNLNGWT